MRTIIQFPRKKLCCFLGFKIKSILSSRDSFTWRTSKKSEVSSLKILHINNIISDMSFMEIKNKNRPNTDHWGTQERIDFHSEFWPNLCSKLSKNISNRDNGSPWILLLYTFIPDFIVNLGKSSHERCSMKKGVLKNFAKFTGKHKRARVSFLHIDNIP